MQFTLSKKLGMWVVDKSPDVHNHPLITTPSKLIKHHSHSKYHRTTVCKYMVSDLNHEGLKAYQITRAVNVMKPNEEADITPRQCSKASDKEFCSHMVFVERRPSLIKYTQASKQKQPDV
ncbi:hypothetical protein RJ639_013379 [Escallonia herrerae]|uniref:Uncharacterized protein n=1 Tax=Escallonia herrerae TaxID=1293975 RepID=A0AA88VIQ8_9ASTE|nr:hypothetical protein RJ639_013379 [Escallonia herrerae]